MTAQHHYMRATFICIAGLRTRTSARSPWRSLRPSTLSQDARPPPIDCFKLLAPVVMGPCVRRDDKECWANSLADFTVSSLRTQGPILRGLSTQSCGDMRRSEQAHRRIPSKLQLRDLPRCHRHNLNRMSRNAARARHSQPISLPGISTEAEIKKQVG